MDKLSLTVAQNAYGMEILSLQVTQNAFMAWIYVPLTILLQPNGMGSPFRLCYVHEYGSLGTPHFMILREDASVDGMVNQ